MLFEGLFKTSSKAVSLTKDGRVWVASGLGYADLVMKGVVYSAATAVSGVAPGTALGTTGAFTLHNPMGSGVYAAVIQGSMGYLSGTLGAGMVVWAANVNPQLALPTGTGITATNLFLGAKRATGQVLPFTTSTIATPILVRPAFNLDASLATTAGIGGFPLVDYVNGALVIAPGGSLSLHGIAAAGATPLVVFGAIWAEIPEDDVK